MANNTVDTAFGILGRDPARAARFGHAMSIYATKPEYAPRWLVDHYAWDALVSLQKLSKVNVLAIGGGSYAHVVVELVQRFENLDITIQDLPAMLPTTSDSKAAEGPVPSNLQDRVDLAPTDDLFAPQTARDNDVILLRWVLHMWPNKYCIRLLRAQIPALKHGVKLIIQDSCLPEPGTVALWREQDLRSATLIPSTHTVQF